MELETKLWKLRLIVLSGTAPKLESNAVGVTKGRYHSLFLLAFLVHHCGPNDDWSPNFPIRWSQEQRK